MSEYEPELGQIAFGQPYKQHECSYELQGAIAFLAEMMPVNENPFANQAVGRKDYGAFQAESYSWNDDYEQPWNFKWRDLEVSWYKYQGRGMSCNRVPSWEEVREMVIDCLRSIPPQPNPIKQEKE